MKVALVHDWLISSGGGEAVLEEIAKLFPGDIYTLVTDRDKLKGSFFENQKVTSSFIQKMPFAKRKFRSYLPFFPLAIEQFDLRDYPLILSSSHAVAKGVLTHPDQLHICYCHTPMRYAWDLYHQYLNDSGLSRGLKGMVAKCFLHYLRLWDTQSASRVDVYIANSALVARRIKNLYGRDATVIYPPVNTNYFTLRTDKEDFYLAASRLVPYKKMDLIVEAFKHLPNKRLVVIGDGPDMAKVRSRAGKNVEILGYQPDDVLRDHLQRAKAFVFAAQEDFGILPVEAQSCGTPVIAYGKGGIRETVIEGNTGLFFGDQNVDSLLQGIQNFEDSVHLFHPASIRAHAEKFSGERFQREFDTFIQKKIQEYK